MKIQKQECYANDYLKKYPSNHFDVKSLIIKPYSSAIKNFKIAFQRNSNPNQTLQRRVKHALAGFALSIPLINALVISCLRLMNRKISVQISPQPEIAKSTTRILPNQKITERFVWDVADAATGILYLANEKAKDGSSYAVTQLLLDQMYYKDPKAAFFTKEGDYLPVCPSQTEYAIAPCCILKEPYHFEIIKKILTSYQNLSPKPLKLFIPTPVFPKLGVPHALLLIIEADEHDSQRANISVVNTLGGGYQSAQHQIMNQAQQVFSSSKSIVKNYNTGQQSDGYSCGWQMIKNIGYLKNQTNIQKTLHEKRYPKYDIEDVYNNEFHPYALEAKNRYNNEYTKEEKISVYQELKRREQEDNPIYQK